MQGDVTTQLKNITWSNVSFEKTKLLLLRIFLKNIVMFAGDLDLF